MSFEDDFFKGGRLQAENWDPYAVLGVARNATADEIRHTYRKLAKEHHPDVRPNDQEAEEKFKRMTAAFNLLGDATKRGRFDRGEIDANENERSTQPPPPPPRSRRSNSTSAPLENARQDVESIFGTSTSSAGSAANPRKSFTEEIFGKRQMSEGEEEKLAELRRRLMGSE